MENYGYLDREELTAYDRYVLSKKNNKVEETSSSLAPKFNNVIENKSVKPYDNNYDYYQFGDNESKVSATKRKLNAYDKYLYQQLNRTAPAEERVMTSDEFYLVNGEKKRKGENRFGKMFNNVTFKKGGKLILAFYVIIMVALASILIVANTTDIANNDYANASVNSISESKSVVSSMTIEEEDSKENNWFDRLCDAINK